MPIFNYQKHCDEMVGVVDRLATKSKRWSSDLNSVIITMQSFWLPPELWKAVFSTATHYEGEHDVYEWILRSERTKNLNSDDIELELARLNIASSYSSPFLLMDVPEFQDLMKVRLTLIFVCKDWYDMAIEHLYQSIIIRGVKSIPGCIDLLKKNGILRRIVKRLEVYEDDEESDVWHLGVVRRMVAQVVELCPNLLIFSGTVELNEPHSSIEVVDVPLRPSLANHCHNLQHVMGHKILDRFPAMNFFRYINSFANLIALQLPPHISSLAATEKPSIILPCLRILDLGNQVPLIPFEFGAYLGRWDLPSLDTVHLGTITRQVALQRFWAKHGKGLQTIKIYNAQDNYIGRRLVETNLGIDSQPDVLFPNLRQLIILHNTPGNLTTLFLPSTSLEIYEIALIETWPIDSIQINHLINQIGVHHFAHLDSSNGVNAPNLKQARISGYPQDAQAVGGSELGIYEMLESECERWEKKLGVRAVSLEKLRRVD